MIPSLTAVQTQAPLRYEETGQQRTEQLTSQERAQERTQQIQPPALLRRRFGCRATLSRARISYLQHGGLYLPCELHYPLRTRVCLLLSVTGEESELCLSATVAMTGPLPGIWAGRQGIAVAFHDADATAA